MCLIFHASFGQLRSENKILGISLSYGQTRSLCDGPISSNIHIFHIGSTWCLYTRERFPSFEWYMRYFGMKQNLHAINKIALLNTWHYNWFSYSGGFMFETRIIFSKMKFPSRECLMIFWPLTIYSDFPTDQTFHQFHDLNTELDLHRITSGFYRAYATDAACQ